MFLSCCAAFRVVEDSRDLLTFWVFFVGVGKHRISVLETSRCFIPQIFADLSTTVRNRFVFGWGARLFWGRWKSEPRTE